MTIPKPVVRSYRDLFAWQRGMLVIAETYLITKAFPKCEVYGLASQMRRAAVSIPANIAEGHARRSPRDYLRFLGFALGSVRELETYIEVTRMLGYASDERLARLLGFADETARLLSRLRLVLESRLPN